MFDRSHTGRSVSTKFKLTHVEAATTSRTSVWENIPRRVVMILLRGWASAEWREAWTLCRPGRSHLRAAHWLLAGTSVGCWSDTHASPPWSLLKGELAVSSSPGYGWSHGRPWRTAGTRVLQEGPREAVEGGETQHRGRIWRLRVATSPRVTCDLPLSLSSRPSQLRPVWGSQTESRVRPVVSVVPKELGLWLPLMSRQRPGCRWPAAPSMPSSGQTCTPTALHLLFSQLNYAISLLTPGRGMACFEKLLMPSLANPGASQSPEATLVQTPEVLHGPARDTSG